MATFICLCCHKEFSAFKSAHRKYCSHACADQSNRTGHEMRSCLACGKSFEARSSKNQKYCSKNCADKHQHDKKTNPNWKTHICEWCGKSFSRYRTDNVRFCNRECYSNWMTEGRKGDKNPAYKDGRILANRGSRWPTIRQEVRRRDGNKCQICGRNPKTNESRILSVHHIKPYREFATSEDANDVSNLITLCRACHDKVESGKLACPQPLL